MDGLRTKTKQPSKLQSLRSAHRYPVEQQYQHHTPEHQQNQEGKTNKLCFAMEKAFSIDTANWLAMETREGREITAICTLYFLYCA